MDARSGTNRWWENYLVRYLMPSIAGMFIIAWLDQRTNSALSRYLLFVVPTDGKLETAQLIAWFLFGNLFCYVASYPILVFHATRALDFRSVKADARSYVTNPYTVTLLVGLLGFALSLFDECSFILAAVLVALYAGYQLIRISKAFFVFDRYGFKEGFEASAAYAFLSKLSKRRSITIKTSETDDDEEVKAERERDLADSYRHLREHGNSAFIFMLEIILCVVSYLSLRETGGVGSGLDALTRLAIVWSFWVAPAVWVHFAAQHLERRYSLWTKEAK